MDWRLPNGRRICGFYLLTEETSNDYPGSEEEFQNLVRSAIKALHSNNVHLGGSESISYDAIDKQVIFSDFQNSRRKNGCLLWDNQLYIPSGIIENSRKHQIVLLKDAVHESFKNKRL
ncbi:hypothetical protein DFJ63DRAFT_311488 [Scheffersomyces coipomensis]|uniref:uncharacterized protein n=1 Tax=Scheffersomyces coipomensis TaxID=1788519 RepID=UPI00315CC700